LLTVYCNCLLNCGSEHNFSGAMNRALADRLGATKLPHILIFEKNSSLPIHFSGEDVNLPSLAEFATEHSGFYVNLPGNVEIYDEYARSFLSVNEHDKKLHFLTEAESALEEILERDKEDAEYYIKVSIFLGSHWLSSSYV